MYYWKCWYDTRRGILAYVAVVAFCAVLWLFPRHSRVLAPTPGEEARLVVSWSIVCTWILALAFGATGPGVDIGQGRGEFLLTRPRSRAYVAWVGWFAGLIETVALLGLTVGVMTLCALVRSGGLWYRTPWEFKTSPTMFLVSLALIALVTYGLTYLLTMLFKSGTRAIIGTLAITIGYAMTGEWLQDYLGFSLPSLALLSHQGHNAWLVLGWTVVALACPVAAQIVLERAEV